MNRSGYIDVDRLQAETTLESAAAKCGIALDVKGGGPEVRIDCPFNCAGDHCGRREIAINTDNPQKIFMCHSYQCGFRGNLLTLMHGWLSGSKPTGGKLKGEEFQRVKNILASEALASQSGSSNSAPSTAETTLPEKNIPLSQSPDEGVRELHNLDEKLVQDVESMSPMSARYIRRHSCLTSESMRKWRCGYLPRDAGGDRRGWSLRGHIVYPVLSEQGEVLAWVGRDVHYEEKELEFRRLVALNRAGKPIPAKHRFPKGFHRGQELFGQQASRLKEDGYREFIEKHGLVIVEGFNDVIGLDNLRIPALGLMSNRMTVSQGEKIVQWARHLSNGKVLLMLDCEENAVEGAKDALWFLAQHKLDVRVAWSPTMYDGSFNRRQPESVSETDISKILKGWSS